MRFAEIRRDESGRIGFAFGAVLPEVLWILLSPDLSPALEAGLSSSEYRNLARIKPAEYIFDVRLILCREGQ